MCKNNTKVNLSNFVAKPWLIVACNSYEAEPDLYNIRAAFETEEEAKKVLTKYVCQYNCVQIINIVEYINNVFGE